MCIVFQCNPFAKEHLVVLVNIFGRASSDSDSLWEFIL